MKHFICASFLRRPILGVFGVRHFGPKATKDAFLVHKRTKGSSGSTNTETFFGVHSTHSRQEILVISTGGRERALQ